MEDQQETDTPTYINYRVRFIDRKKLFGQRDQVEALAGQVRALLREGKTGELKTLLDQYYPPDLADVMEFLDDVQDKAVYDLLENPEAADVLDELDDCTKEKLIRSSSPERLARITECLPPDEGADILGFLSKEEADQVLSLVAPELAQQLRFLLGFPKESAGGIMSLGFTAVLGTATAAEALQKYKYTADLETTFVVYVVDEQGALQGGIDIHKLLAAGENVPSQDLMVSGLPWVYPEMDREDVSRIFARYDLNALPVVERGPIHRLLGVITSDDVIDVIEAETTEDMLRIAGSDAQEMERRSPARTALLRLPWIMATMFIELGAGFVIRFYNPTLARVLLLASFMPVISAISGNTGLQSATIIVRGLSAGVIRVTDWRLAISRQLVMTLILGSVAGLTLGIIGAIWYGKWTFGLVVAVGMFAAVNIAGIVGTVVPLTSKRLGFDPAITSGPFETAFQDVVGISIFLGLATLMINYLIR